MKVRTIATVTVVGLATFAGSIWAGPVGIQRAPSSAEQATTLAQLEAKRERASWEVLQHDSKGPLLVRRIDKYQQLNDLVNRIQSGQAVSPDEIDEALQPTTR